MKQYIITEDKLKAILAYLAKRPYEEVAQGIQILSTLPELKEEAKNEKKAEKKEEPKIEEKKEEKK